MSPEQAISEPENVQNLLYENEFDLRENEPVGGTHFHMNGLTIRLVFTQHQNATLKWLHGPYCKLILGAFVCMNQPKVKEKLASFFVQLRKLV